MNFHIRPHLFISWLRKEVLNRISLDLHIYINQSERPTVLPNHHFNMQFTSFYGLGKKVTDLLILCS